MRWKLSYKVANREATYPGSYTTETITAATDSTADKHMMDSFSEISMTGKTVSCMMLILVERLAGSDGADTYSADVKLDEFDIHYKHSAFGAAP